MSSSYGKWTNKLHQLINCFYLHVACGMQDQDLLTCMVSLIKHGRMG
jgi:hypothetical protein